MDVEHVYAMAAPPAERSGEVSPQPITLLYHHRTQSKDGQSVHIEEILSALRSQGHRVVTIAPSRTDDVDFGGEAAGAGLLKRLIPKALYELLELGYSAIEVWRLARAIIRYRPDALYQRANLSMVSGPIIARLFRLPFLLEVNAPLAEERDRFGGLALPWLARACERWCWRAADRVLPVTSVLGRMIGDAGVRPERIEVIANGVDPLRFRPDDDVAAKQALGLDGRIVLGFVGFVREWHQADWALDFMAGSDAPPNCHFLLVGDGPSRPAIEAAARARRLLDRVTITGIVPRVAVSAHIAAFDIALQPQVVAYASPLKLFEYMALERAIVAPDAANIREVLTNDLDALLFQQGNGAAFIAALARLAGDGELRRRLGRSARRTIETRNLTWDDNARRIVTMIRALADARAQAPSGSRMRQA